MGLNAFGVEYEGLFGFGMITEVDSLKCFGQHSCSMHALAKTSNTSAHVGSARTNLRCRHVTWSGPGAERAEHACNAWLSSI